MTLRDVVTVLQRAEMVRRISLEIEGYVIELGADGRLVLLQLDELMGGVEADRRLVAKDYVVDAPDLELADVMNRLSDLDDDMLLDLARGRGRRSSSRPASRSTRPCSRAGSACSTRSPGSRRRCRTTSSTGSATCRRSCGRARPISCEVEGVGDARARAIKDGLARLAETSILERYT